MTEETAEPATDGSAETPEDGAASPAEGPSPDETQPTVELSLYQLSVSVSGRSGDDLADVQSTASELMDFLVDRAETLEEEPDDRGLG